MARKADWSLIDAQIKARDSQDRQGRFSSSVPRTGMPSTHTQYREGHLAGIRSSYPEGYTQTRKAEVGSPVGTDYGTAAIRRAKAHQAESTWAVPDLGPGRGRYQPESSSYSPTRSSSQGNILPARLGSGLGMPLDDRSGTQAAYREADRSGIRAARDSRGAGDQRYIKQASTQTAYHLADSAPLKDYKPRGKTVRDKSKSTGTNIQAFY